MKTIAFMVTSSPLHPNTQSALAIIKACYENPTVQVTGVFFYQDGVSNANSNISIPSDEYNALPQWQQLVEAYQAKLHLCITAGEKRGMTDAENENNISPCFIVSGLGEMVELMNNSDRLVQL